jgi:DNA-directed RNA polymerase specialized sigma24 family protein
VKAEAIATMAGQQRTIAEAVRQYGRSLFAFIRGRVNSDADAEDILQDVWMRTAVSPRWRRSSR